MAAQKFSQNQKVFAKVRGYPPWPARVIATLDETPNKQKYQVYFYGTHETGNCKQEELFDYVEFKGKYGKGVKRKHFTEAMQEIELELNPPSESRPNVELTPFESNGVDSTPVATLASDTPTDKDSVTDKDSDDEGNLVIDEAPALKDKMKLDNGKNLKRKLSTTITDTPETPQNEILPAEITSRSGRKIKPKKFSDGHAEFTTPVTPKFSKNKGGKTTARKVSEENVLNTNGDQVELHWEGRQNSHDLIDKTEQSELPKSVKKDIQKAVKKKVEEIRPEQLYNDNESLEILKTEVHLLDADCRIKASLSLNEAKCDDCLKAMDEILDLKLSADMLNKHPEVMDTVRKLKKYVGNVSQWRLTPQEEEKFNEHAKMIRSKAETMYNKFKSLFTIPNGTSFNEVYSTERKLFVNKNRDLTVDQIFSVKEESFS